MPLQLDEIVCENDQRRVAKDNGCQVFVLLSFERVSCIAYRYLLYRSCEENVTRRGTDDMTRTDSLLRCSSASSPCHYPLDKLPL
jgi:hypothetical protein